MVNQFEEVRPFDGVAACEHKHRNLQSRYLVDQLLTLLGAELHWVSVRLSRGAAMDTCQIAGLGDLPDRDEWTFVEVDGVDERIHNPM